MIALFDIGSTLIDGPPYGPTRRLLEMLGLETSEGPRMDRLLFCSSSKTPTDLARSVEEEFGVRAVAACTELWNAQLDEAYVLPGAREAIECLRAARVPRAYLSNIWPPFYERFRREFVGESDQRQFLSFQTGLMKPDPAFFHRAIKELDSPAGEMVMIGDTYKNDILPAIQLGMKTIWVLHRPDKERSALVEVVNGVAPRPSVTLGSIGELNLSVLRGLFSK
jgi:HAD superfamily hydrolase (TIGR01549 family)